MNNNNQNRTIIYATNEFIFGEQGDWEEGDNIQEAEEKASAVLEEQGHSQDQIKHLLTLYKRTSINSMTTLPSIDWNELYAHCVKCRGYGWVSDTAYSAVLKQAMAVEGDNFSIPKVDMSEVSKNDLPHDQQIAYHKFISDEELQKILNTPSPTLVNERG